MRFLVKQGLLAAMLAAIPLTAHCATLDERVAQCNACHGEGGNSVMESIPSLAGQPDFFLLNQLVLLREGVRQIDAMSDIVKPLTDSEIQDLAAYYAKQPAKLTGDQPQAEKVEAGAKLATQKRCNSCHGNELMGDQQVPRIAKQRVDYLISSLKSYRDNTRTGADTSMSAMIFGLSDADLEALAHYAASR